MQRDGKPARRRHWKATCWATALVAVFIFQLAHAQTGASLLLPSAMAYDSVGNLYFVDTNRNQVLESTLGGALVIVAGNGTQGFAGDGSAAVNAELNSPQGIAIGTDGTIYIADTGNQRIRAVAAGQISTFAGSGARGFAGDGSSALSAAFSQPAALAVDSADALLICDSLNHRVRKVASGVITTIAGNGVQGFAGDGGFASTAELDTPAGVAVGADGRVFIADSHNQRIRVIAADGTMQTLVGTGVGGYSGDGGAASTSKLFLPRGLAALPGGSLLVADSNNERVRAVNAQGTISTVVGSGVQGVSSEGTGNSVAMLNSPRAVSLSAFAEPAVADSANRMFRVVAPSSSLYSPSGLISGRASSIALSVTSNAVYGQLGATAVVTGSIGTPQGNVQLMDGGSLTGQNTLSGGTAGFSSLGLSAGTHSLTATYLGDGLNPVATSSTASVSVAPAMLVAMANPASVAYGENIPVLTGTLSGVLTQDASAVNAVFATSAPNLAPAGIYSITAVLNGTAAANYSVTMSANSGSLTVVRALASVVEQLPSQGYAGLPVLLSVQVTPSARGTATGTVTFMDGSSAAASVSLVGGIASATYLSPTQGIHTISAVYSGDGNFLSGQSSSGTFNIAAMPDFSVALQGSASQTVQGGLIATYAIAVAGVSGPFSGAVAMASSGVPAGATVSFSPAQVIPGAGLSMVTMSVQTTAGMASRRAGTADWRLAILLVVPFVRRKRWNLRCAGAAFLCFCIMALTGCGTRTLGSGSQASATYNMTVTGTGTNLAGTVVAHSVPVTLVVQ
jgi:sugar lactone lactonase YvrE